MAIAFVQGKAFDGGPAAAEALAFPSNVTAGNLLLAYINEFQTTTPTTASPVTDSKGNTWTAVDAWAGTFNSAEQQRLYYAIANGSGANTVTFHGDSSSDYYGVIIAEFSGIDTTTPLTTVHGTDGRQQLTGTPTTPSFTPAAGNLAIAVYANAEGAETTTPGTGWTDGGTHQLTSTTGNGDNCSMIYQLSAAGTAITGSWTVSPAPSSAGTSTGTLWAVFKAATGGAADPFPSGYNVLPAALLQFPVYRM